MKKNIFLISGVLVLVFGVVLVQNNQKQNVQQVIVSRSLKPTITTTGRNTFSYKGQAEKDALTLLKEKTSVEQEKSGLVSSINSKKAESTKHEYWAFYVNGKMAEVGPSDYKTKDTDIIDWKIETY